MKHTSTLLNRLTLCFLAISLVVITSTGCKLDSIFPSQSNDFESFAKESESIESNAHEPNWFVNSEIAMQTAARDNKLVMAMFTGSDWCTWCVKLEKEVFAQKDFRKWADKNVVPLKLDFPKKTKQDRETRAHNESMLAQYRDHVKGYPSVLFIDARGEVVAKMGYARGGPKNWIAKAEEKLNR